MGSLKKVRLSSNALISKGQFLGEPVAIFKKNPLFDLFGELYRIEAAKHKGPEWPAAYKVEVVHHEDYASCKFVYRIKNISPMQLGDRLNVTFDQYGFNVPVIAQDEMAAMARAVEILDKYAEEYNGY